MVYLCSSKVCPDSYSGWKQNNRFSKLIWSDFRAPELCLPAHRNRKHLYRICLLMFSGPVLTAIHFFNQWPSESFNRLVFSAIFLALWPKNRFRFRIAKPASNENRMASLSNKWNNFPKTSADSFSVGGYSPHENCHKSRKLNNLSLCSGPIWLMLPTQKKIQFPSRLITVVCLIYSLFQLFRRIYGEYSECPLYVCMSKRTAPVWLADANEYANAQFKPQMHPTRFGSPSFGLCSIAFRISKAST